MSARRKRVISTDEIQFNHKPAKMLLTEKKGVSWNGQTSNIIGICSYCVLDKPVFEWNQVLLHPEPDHMVVFLLSDGAHHKKPHSAIPKLVTSGHRLLKLVANISSHFNHLVKRGSAAGTLVKWLPIKVANPSKIDKFEWFIAGWLKMTP